MFILNYLKKITISIPCNISSIYDILAIMSQRLPKVWPCWKKSGRNLQKMRCKKISLRGFYIFGILRTSRFHFCVITFNKDGGIFLICIFPKWPPRLSITLKLSHIATCPNISLLIFC